MSEEYSRDMMKVAVAKILQTIGWNSIQSTPMEILTDIAVQYVMQLAKLTHDYSNEFGCVEPNLDHLGLAFRDFHVNLNELDEYVTYVNFGQPPTPVPKYPIPKEDNLNFLKPGSKEVVTRQVHIHEHLPPMYQINEVNENEAEVNVKTEETDKDINNESTPVFKRPAEVSPGESFKRLRLLMEEEGRPTREISSVMMTTSGYISPAREGKLPESRTPLASLDTITAPNTNTNINNGNAAKSNKVLKKQEKKKEKIGKELFKALPEEKTVKKMTTMKDVVKLKQMKAVNAINNANGPAPLSNNNFVINNEVKVPPVPPSTHSSSVKSNNSSNKINKALAAARLKTEKLNTTITPIPMNKITALPTSHDVVDKLFTEPDKKKVNILKKISNVKNDKLENKIVKIKEEIKQESRESSPDLIIDESNEMNNKVHISNDITIELIDAVPNKTQEKSEKPYFDDDSPPGTPSTPKTPEMISQSPPLTKEKRKRKDKSRIKKVQKTSPAVLENETGSYMDLERPKTPEANHLLPTLPPMPLTDFFFPQFPRPGLIPPPLPNPLMQNPLLPSPYSIFAPFNPSNYFCPPKQAPLNFPPQPPLKQEESKMKSPEVTSVSSTDIPGSSNATSERVQISPKTEKKTKEHKKEKKDKIKKKNKKDKIKNKAEKKKLKEEKKDKIKKEKKEKRKEKEVHQQASQQPPASIRENLEIAIPKLTIKMGTPSPRPETPDTKKLNIKPLVKKDEEEKSKEPEIVKRELSPELAKISALVTGQPKPKAAPQPPPPSAVQKEDPKEESASVPAQRNHPGPGRPRIHPIKQKTLKPNKRQVPVKDSEGNEVWICPACGRQDDGSPMIGCDDCDAWYHWVCVGIQVPPDDNEDWYCRVCIVKKQEVLQSDKKKKRKKREKKEH